MSGSYNWRRATNEEIRQYYDQSFPDRVEDLPRHISPTGPKEFGLSFRGPYPVCSNRRPKDFIRRSTWSTSPDGERMLPEFGDWQQLMEFIQHPARSDPLRGSEYALADPATVETSEPVPEAVYYRLDHWDRPWVLMVDIDAKDIAFDRAKTILADRSNESMSREELLVESGVKGAPPGGYPYSFTDIDRAIEYGFEVKSLFEEKLAAEDVRVVYSGQGVHVYVLDDDDSHAYDVAARKAITKLLQEKHAIPIDAPVTTDQKRFGRLPYSLHAEVCRLVTPIQSPDFDPRTEAIPPFLSTEVTA